MEGLLSLQDGGEVLGRIKSSDPVNNSTVKKQRVTSACPGLGGSRDSAVASGLCEMTHALYNCSHSVFQCLLFVIMVCLSRPRGLSFWSRSPS